MYIKGKLLQQPRTSLRGTAAIVRRAADGSMFEGGICQEGEEEKSAREGSRRQAVGERDTKPTYNRCAGTVGVPPARGVGSRYVRASPRNFSGLSRQGATSPLCVPRCTSLPLNTHQFAG